MKTPWPSSCFGAVSSVARYRSTSSSSPFTRTSSISRPAARLITARISIRRYAFPPGSNSSGSKANAAPEPFEKAALLAVQGHGSSDPVNAPRSTLPPPLNLPTRGSESAFLYYYRVGKAYGGFYFTGVKAVWYNNQAARAIRARIRRDMAANQDKHYTDSSLALLTRAEFQVLGRNAHDVGKLPLFSVLLALLGEWLPVFVPFMPGVVPGTCRIPAQVAGMREKAEQRRRTSFRHGIAGPEREAAVVNAWANIAKSSHRDGSWPWPVCSNPYAATILARLRPEQLWHLSCTLNLHARVWDWVNVAPPASWLRRGLAKRVAYLASDDLLLLKYGGEAALRPEELHIACEERGIDVSGRREEVLRTELREWLRRQEKDRGRGFAILHMLFRRPNAWETSGEKS